MHRLNNTKCTLLDRKTEERVHVLTVRCRLSGRLVDIDTALCTCRQKQHS